MAAEPITIDDIAANIEAALGAADLAGFGELLSPDVTWGAPGDKSPACKNREQVMTWYRRGWEEGTTARVLEVTVHGDRLMVGLMVRRDGDYQERWQMLLVGPDGVRDIRGYEDKATAEAACAA